MAKALSCVPILLCLNQLLGSGELVFNMEYPYENMVIKYLLIMMFFNGNNAGNFRSPLYGGGGLTLNIYFPESEVILTIMG